MFFFESCHLVSDTHQAYDKQQEDKVTTELPWQSSLIS